ncbi:MAG: hypothetical protein J6T50_01310 [Lachnospiraceae bacterium]|nr:hypothetical protein [Lachnospiraceae bacterium]MBO7530421.1 hypothetical protein [Lachnospiraceae bacterium]MBP5252982.1 hypothetical protein [Lachnospiraceae bacterium]
MSELYASWYDEVPGGDFISKAPTYKVGEYFDRFHTGEYVSGDLKMKYYWYDPREYGYADDGKLSLLTFLHGTSNSLVGDVCINYTGAELYASDPYQETMGGAYILIPVANEYRDESGKVHGQWGPDYLEIVHRLYLDFIKDKTAGVGLRMLFGNSSGATFVLRLMDNYMDDFDVVLPVGSDAIAEDSVLDKYDEKGKCLFLAICRRDEFHPYEENLKDRMERLHRMKNVFLYVPEWTRNGDKGIASIDGGIEMGQHCLMNAIQSNLMFDDGTPMEPRLPKGVTGWIADYKKENIK